MLSSLTSKGCEVTQPACGDRGKQICKIRHNMSREDGFSTTCLSKIHWTMRERDHKTAQQINNSSESRSHWAHEGRKLGGCCCLLYVEKRLSLHRPLRNDFSRPTLSVFPRRRSHLRKSTFRASNTGITHTRERSPQGLHML